MPEYDVVVVGGGPAGCMAAKYAAKEGASTLIVEEDAEIGKPVQCAGLISRRAIEESELKNESVIKCELEGAIIYSCSHDLRIEAPSQEKHAFAIRRDIFDKELARAALNEGADLILKRKVESVKKRGEGTKLTIIAATANDARVKNEEEIRAQVVIGADGVRSVVAKMAGLNVTKNFLNCVQIEGGYEIDEAFAEIFVGKTIAPGFFAWAIPIAENTARIGLCIDKRFSPHPNPLPFLKRILAEHPIIAKKYKGTQSNFTAGIIPLPVGAGLRGQLRMQRQRQRQKTVRIDGDVGMLLVGDAAAQVKPITGGGVYYGMKCGKIAGETAAKACLEGNMEVLKGYEKRWRKEIGKEIAFGLRVHRLRCALSDKDFDTICHVLSKYDMMQIITNRGDMDYPSFVLRELLKNPSIIMLMAKNIIRYLYAK